VAKPYYSIILDHPVNEVWAVIRPFDHYAWAGVESDTIIEEGKAGDQVGAVRRVTFGGNVLRSFFLLIPTSTALIPTASAERRRSRCATTKQPYASVRSLPTIVHSSSGGQHSIAPPTSRTNG
jgi:hypothetical protein